MTTKPEEKPVLHPAPGSQSPAVIVSGDVCIEVLGVPMPAPPESSRQDNWRLTGEIRTHYRRGGALLLADLVAAAAKVTDPARVVAGPSLSVPPSLAAAGWKATELSEPDFERLTRNEIVHSVLRVADFKTTPDAKKGDATYRVSETLGFSGPIGEEEPKLTPHFPRTATAKLLVLDDTGNRFRRDETQWQPLLDALPSGAFVLHKLHRILPLESAGASVPQNKLWQALRIHRSSRHVVVLDIADLRKAGAVVSHRLSWERTAVELVSQLRTVTAFKQLAACQWLVVRFGLDGALVWHQPSQPDQAEPLAWLIYDPQSLEGGFATSRAGEMVGYGSAFVAGISASLFIAPAVLTVKQGGLPDALRDGITLGLVAARRLFHLGFGPKLKPDVLFEPTYPAEALFHPHGQAPKEAQPGAFHLIPIPMVAKEWPTWTILQTLLPGGLALESSAHDLATGKNPPPALAPVPLAVFAKFSTYDRADAESYQAISNLIREYLHAPSPPRPLNIAVFGPPGSGKSFGVNQVVESIAGDAFKLEKIVLNLAQFTTPDQIAVQLHLVRDAVLRGKVPLVFFDEFDASVGGTPLFWLKFLLAPMQDGEFLDHGASHPIGKAIFIFAGGTCESYAEFDREPRHDDQTAQTDRKKAKLPDFLSRLRGFLDIRGVNHQGGYRGPALLRRASVLRFQLKEKHPSLFNADGTLHISPAVLRAFLHVPGFEHGVRSLEAIIDMSQLSGQLRFDPAFLPSQTQLGLHVIPTTKARTDLFGPGFLDLVSAPFPWADAGTRDKIAEKIHANYLTRLTSRDPKKPSHQDWKTLSEFYKDSNREQADDIPRKLRLLGLDYRQTGTGKASQTVTDLNAPDYKSKSEAAAKDEHDRWTAARRRDGWIYGPLENAILLTHPDICDWETLSDSSKNKDRNAILDIPSALEAPSLEVFDPAVK